MATNLEALHRRFTEIEQELQDPQVIANGSVYAKLLREHGALVKPMQRYLEFKRAADDVTVAEQAIADGKEDPDLISMYHEELPAMRARKETALQVLLDTLASDDADSSRNCFVEIRAGTGGDEAALFVEDLFRLYTNYANHRGWNLEVQNTSPGEKGLKEITFAIRGKNVYKFMQFEAGTHRVQRVPETEAKGRIHTSAVTVAVLPEVEDMEVEVKDDDLRVDTYCASGAGGQHVNKTASAVRITHLPTGIAVACQDERSQHKNRARAMKILRSRIYEKTVADRKAKEDSLRKNMIGSGDRSEKIRTYNYPQSRVTDHRVNVSWHNLTDIMNGHMEEVSDALVTHSKNEKIKALQLT